jgi:hypothetical protein
MGGVRGGGSPPIGAGEAGRAWCGAQGPWLSLHGRSIPRIRSDAHVLAAGKTPVCVLGFPGCFTAWNPTKIEFLEDF